MPQREPPIIEPAGGLGGALSPTPSGQTARSGILDGDHYLNTPSIYVPNPAERASVGGPGPFNGPKSPGAPSPEDSVVGNPIVIGR